MISHLFDRIFFWIHIMLKQLHTKFFILGIEDDYAKQVLSLQILFKLLRFNT